MTISRRKFIAGASAMPNGNGHPCVQASLTGLDSLQRSSAMANHYAVSLETHWRGAGTPEASTRESMKALKEALAKAGTGC